MDCYFYNSKKKVAKPSPEAPPAVEGHTLFMVEKKPEETTAFAELCSTYKPHILVKMAERRNEKGLKTTSNFGLYRNISSEEYKKLSPSAKAAWEAYAKDLNDKSVADWERPPDADKILRYVPFILTKCIQGLLKFAVIKTISNQCCDVL